MFAIIRLMKREICIGTAVFLLISWGLALPCRAADPQTAAASAAAPSTPQSLDPLANFTSQVTSFFNDPNITSLWTHNSLTAWIILLASIFVGMVAGKTCSILLQRAALRKGKTPIKFFLDLAGPANLALITMGLQFGLLNISMSPVLRTFFFKLQVLLYSIAAFWYAYNLISIVDALFHQFGRKTDSSLAIHVAPLVRRTLRIFLIVVGTMFVVQSVFEKDISAWLAGLGIAGLAVSFAAQDSLKNLFGSITIILDRSFKIGERIVCSGCDGVIEDIGLRTTRVRTSAGHLVSIPNANIVNSPVENVSRRQGIRRNFNLALKIDTSAEKMKLAIKIIHDILAEKEISGPIHPTINGKIAPPRIVFSEYKTNSLILNVSYWFAPPNNEDYESHAEKINLRILEEFNRAGICLANV
jgi:MscS family membrane protein